MTIRVFLLDDHEMVREGIRSLIESDAEIEVVGQAATVAEALIRIPEAMPNVALLDVRLEDGSGVEVCREIRSSHPDIACLMLTSFADDEAIYASVMAGAAGYVLKRVRSGDLIGDVKAVASGRSLMDPRSVADVVQRMSQRLTSHSPLDALTPQERQLLVYITDGLTNQQVAEAMFLSEKTVKNYVTSLLMKLNLSNRTQAAVLATRLDVQRGAPPSAS